MKTASLAIFRLAAAFLSCGLAACSFTESLAPLPKRDESFSYFGPGSERVLKSSVKPFTFTEDSYTLDLFQTGNVEAMAALEAKLTEEPKRQLLLAGFANDSGTAEFNRVLGEQRAQAVRRALLEQGIAADRLHTVSYGNELDARTGEAGRRVEVGLVEEVE